MDNTGYAEDTIQAVSDSLWARAVSVIVKVSELYSYDSDRLPDGNLLKTLIRRNESPCHRTLMARNFDARADHARPSALLRNHCRDNFGGKYFAIQFYMFKSQDDMQSSLPCLASLSVVLDESLGNSGEVECRAFVDFFHISSLASESLWLSHACAQEDFQEAMRETDIMHTVIRFI